MSKNPLCPNCKTHRMKRHTPTVGGKLRWQCVYRVDGHRIYCYSTTDPTAPVRAASGSGEPTQPLVFKRPLGPVSRYIITSAQNATPVHEDFFKALLQYAKHTGAELLVIPLRYRNPTSIFGAEDRNQQWWFGRPTWNQTKREWIPHPYTKYLWNQRKRINNNLVVMADIKTQAAASDPLSGFESISGPESAIFGHTKLQQKVIPVPKNRLPKILTTTGACTERNYTDTKRGKIGEFHHALAAVVVEFEGQIFHMRHINADVRTGEFTDLRHTYSQRGVRVAQRPKALVLGDTHVDFRDPKVEAATFGPGGIADYLNPEVVVFHDLLDNYAINPHHLGNPFNAVAKLRAGRNSAAREVQRAISYARDRASDDRAVVVVSSNHDDFLRRWILKADWKEDPENAEFYLDTALAMLRATKLGTGGTETPNPFAMLLARDAPNVRALGPNESFVLAGVELGMHGDVGPSGARGSIRNLRRIGQRSIIGHSHTPGIEEGCYQVGTSTYLRLEYNAGPSSWLNTHCILHADGKRQLINIIDGTWRME
jgi:hypothetical protein